MQQFNYIDVTYNKAQALLLWKIKDTGMPNFCLKALEEFQVFSTWVRTYFKDVKERPLRFIVSASAHQGIYNMGGDLPYFLKCIKTNATEKLRSYAHLSVDAIHAIHTAFGLPAITIALLEGNAYGGGFECALAHDFILAQDTVKLGLPENMFNLFPGMGAHSLLYRKTTCQDADAIIRSDKVYKARYFETLGLVAKTFRNGEGNATLEAFLKLLQVHFNFEYHHIKCKKCVQPLRKSELLSITDIWVDACMQTTAFDLRKMQRLGAAQARNVHPKVF
jgi:DSF synthase